MKAHTLILIPGQLPSLTPGFLITTLDGGRGISLPLICAGIAKHKTCALLDAAHPAIVKSNGRIYDVFVKLNEGTTFLNKDSYITLQRSQYNDKKNLILSDKRWPDLNIQIAKGRPNGSLGPGLQAFKNDDAVVFDWENQSYVIYQQGEQIFLEASSPKWDICIIDKQMERVEMTGQN